MIIGDRIRGRRLELDWPQSLLAQRLGVGEMTISRWERSVMVPRLETVERLADILGLRPEWLAYGSGARLAGEAA